MAYLKWLGIKCQSKILYPEKVSFKYADKIKILGSTRAKRTYDIEDIC